MVKIRSILDWIRRHTALILGILIALDILHRIISLAAGPFPLFKDASGYWDLGKSLAAGRGLTGDFPEGLRTPIYPVYLAFFQAVFGPYALQAAIIGQHILGMATSLVLYALCARMTGDSRFGLLAYCVCALGFGRIQFDNFILSEALFIFLLTLHLSLFISILRKPSLLHASASGFLLGLSILTRPVALLLCVVELFPLFLMAAKNTKEASIKVRQAALVFLVFTIIVVVPWPIRNLVRFGDFVVVRDLGIRHWENTFNKKAAGLSLPKGEFSEKIKTTNWRDGFVVAGALRHTGIEDSEISRLMKKTARQARREQPWPYLRSLAANTFLFWIDNEEAIPFYLRSPRSRSNEYADQRIWVAPGFVAPFEGFLRFLYRFPIWLEATFSALAWAGCFLLIGFGGWHRSVGILIAGILIYFCLVTGGMLYPLYRYRVVLQPLMVVSCVTGLWALLSMRSKRHLAARGESTIGRAH